MERNSCTKKQLAIIFLIFTAPVITIGQTYLDIRQKIIPLQSTREDVEKIAKFIKTQGYLTQYEINGRQLDVYYSEAPCLTYGWKIPEDTVIKFNYGLRPGELSYDEIKKTFASIEIKDDAQFRSITDRNRGVEYRSPSGHENVTDIVFMPPAGPSKLRCKGFPEYDPSRYYAPYQEFSIETPQPLDPEGIYPTIYFSSQRPTYVATIFVYCRKGEQSKCQQTANAIKRFAYKTIGTKAKNIRIEFGGYRTSLQIETFLLPKEYPPVIPSPTVPS